LPGFQCRWLVQRNLWPGHQHVGSTNPRTGREVHLLTGSTSNLPRRGRYSVAPSFLGSLQQTRGENQEVRFCRNYFFAIFQSKSHVKPQNELTLPISATLKWHFSYAQTAILDIEIGNQRIPEKRPRLHY